MACRCSMRILRCLARSLVTVAMTRRLRQGQGAFGFVSRPNSKLTDKRHAAKENLDRVWTCLHSQSSSRCPQKHLFHVAVFEIMHMGSSLRDLRDVDDLSDVADKYIKRKQNEAIDQLKIWPPSQNASRHTPSALRHLYLRSDSQQATRKLV